MLEGRLLQQYGSTSEGFAPCLVVFDRTGVEDFVVAAQVIVESFGAAGLKIDAYLVEG